VGSHPTCEYHCLRNLRYQTDPAVTQQTSVNVRFRQNRWSTGMQLLLTLLLHSLSSRLWQSRIVRKLSTFKGNVLPLSAWYKKWPDDWNSSSLSVPTAIMYNYCGPMSGESMFKLSYLISRLRIEGEGIFPFFLFFFYYYLVPSVIVRAVRGLWNETVADSR
jgi:hypothetical protein